MLLFEDLAKLTDEVHRFLGFQPWLALPSSTFDQDVCNSCYVIIL